MMAIEQLNADFGIANQLEFIKGKGQRPVIAIANNNAKALISIYGGQVLSFQPVTEPFDLMFVSEVAYYKEGKAVKGGVPICWPWFGPHPSNSALPAHGFVRNRVWNVLGTEATATGETKVILGLVDTEETKKIWSYSFELQLAIVVGKTLKLELTTRNTGNETFSITQAFHTYFAVGDINQVKVEGLENKTYLDKVAGGVEKQQQGTVEINEEVDRIYTNVPRKLVIDDPKFNRHISIVSEGSKTAVVWNPWIEISNKMRDLEDEAYLSFICVETTNAADDIITIAPNESKKLVVTYDLEHN
ncbi:MAG: D-hexose-6-phosphate mutarotase [Xenococcaceae cyanobacterium MO_207.B15]|nr:D-hexose-6-phosphate mutarotase [Xenococcaceae cyanobacterium MO_207.B15]